MSVNTQIIEGRYHQVYPWFSGTVLVLLTTVLALVVLVPFYGSGMFLMHESQIYGANDFGGTSPLLEWYPLYKDSLTAYITSRIAILMLLFYPVVGSPLLLWFAFGLIRRRRTLTNWARYSGLVVLAFSTLSLLALLIASSKIQIWLLD